MFFAADTYATSASGYVITALLGLVLLFLGSYGFAFRYLLNRQDEHGNLIAVLDKTVTVLKDHDTLLMKLLENRNDANRS